MASIQASLNQLFANTLGAAFAITHHPAVKQNVEDRAKLRELMRVEKAEVAKTKSAQNLGSGGLPASEAMKLQEEKTEPVIKNGEVVGYKNLGKGPVYGPETLLPVAEQEQALLNAQQAVNDQRIRMGKKKTPQGFTVGGQAYGITQQQREQEQTIASLYKALEAKQGVKNAVKQRRSFIEAMQNERVSIGKGESTFGELPSALQKQLASQYSKSERKKVMDKYYGKE